MKHVLFVFTLCLLFAIPQNSYGVIAVAPQKKAELKEMTKAEKKAFRKDLRKKIKAAKKSGALKLRFDDYRTMGVTLSLIGGAGVILGAVLEIGLIYWLGGLVLTAGLVILILYWLDVI